jgi:hypothetical protein
MCPANHINSRSLLRSSSTREPSDPPHRVVLELFSIIDDNNWKTDKTTQKAI